MHQFASVTDHLDLRGGHGPRRSVSHCSAVLKPTPAKASGGTEDDSLLRRSMDRPPSPTAASAKWLSAAAAPPLSTAGEFLVKHDLCGLQFVGARKTAPPLSVKVCLKLFVHALYGMSGAINIYSLGLSYSSATSSAAIFNLLPVVAFFLAVLFGMESLKLKRFHGIAKVFGVVFCIAGVIVLAFYQGPELKSFNHHHLFHQISNSHTGITSHPKRSWILGIFLTTLSTTSWALWTVLQAPMLEAYPSKLLNTTLQMIFSTIQSFFIALVVERDFSRWKLRLDVGLVAVLYSGILVSGVAYYMQVWVIDKSGPVFLSMTMPITLLVTVMLSSFVLGEAVTVGSILGGVIMVGGLYCVLWAKATEQIDDKRLQVSAQPPVQATEV